MNSVTGKSNIISRICTRIPFEMSKRTKMKAVLEDTCPHRFLRPCEDMPYRPKTGLLILHPGEPTLKQEIKPFLTRVQRDKTFSLAMPSIKSAGGWRDPSQIEDQYTAIGGYSPLLKWAAKLGYGLEKRLDKDMKVFSPFKSIVAYRYASPLITKALKEFEIDDVRHMCVISLEPHYFCQKTGPCYDGIYKYYKKHKLPKWTWTIVDRWPLTYLLFGVFAQTIQYELDSLSPERRRDAHIFFVANGMLKDDVRKGDMYLYEVGVSVHNIMRIMNYSNDYTLTWLTPEGCAQTIRPSLDDALCRAYNDGIRNFVVVPISYTCECLDTLYEIDIAILQKYRERWGCEAQILRTTTPNDHIFMISAVAKVIQEALTHEYRGTAKFLSQCHGCRMNTCKNNKQFFEKLLNS